MFLNGPPSCWCRIGNDEKLGDGLVLHTYTLLYLKVMGTSAEQEYSSRGSTCFSRYIDSAYPDCAPELTINHYQALSTIRQPISQTIHHHSPTIDHHEPSSSDNHEPWLIEAPIHRPLTVAPCIIAGHLLSARTTPTTLKMIPCRRREWEYRKRLFDG